MKSKNKLLITDMLAVFAAALSDIALLTMAFMITGSPEQTSYIIALRLLASMLVFFILPKMLKIISMRKFSFLTDLVRALSCLLVIATWNIYVLVLFAIIISFCTGVNSALKNVAFQKFVASEERVVFISKQQFVYHCLSLSAPLLATLIIKISVVQVVFIVESLLLFISALIVWRLSDWDPDVDVAGKGLFSGFGFIFQNIIQRNILFFRLSILTSMIAYQVISTYILTRDYRHIIKSVNINFITSYSDVLALFSIVATASLLLASLLAGKIFKLETLGKSFITGSLLISAGCILWAVAVPGFEVMSYIPGTFMIFMGLSLLRISLYASGQQLTDKARFSEIIATSDMLARSYQSLLGFAIVSIISVITPGGAFLICSLASLGSVFFSRVISREISSS